MVLHPYCSNSGRDLISKYIKNLPIDEKVDAYTVMECLENNEIEKITFKQWKKKVYEVYFYKDNRIFYVVADKENIYLLHACKKQKNKTATRDCLIVTKRAKELGKELGKNFI